MKRVFLHWKINVFDNYITLPGEANHIYMAAGARLYDTGMVPSPTQKQLFPGPTSSGRNQTGLFRRNSSVKILSLPVSSINKEGF